jgi:hypothetical protein
MEGELKRYSSNAERELTDSIDRRGFLGSAAAGAVPTRPLRSAPSCSAPKRRWSRAEDSQAAVEQSSAFPHGRCGPGRAERREDDRLAVIPMDRAAFAAKLASGVPRIQLELSGQDRGTQRWHATARTRLLRDGEELLVARRLREIFEARS